MVADVLERPRQSAPIREPHDAKINIRMSEMTKTLIDKAAAVLGKSRSEFITESARQHAVDVLLDQRLFVLSAEDFAKFKDSLDNPPPPSDRLKALMKRKPLWEK